MRPFRTNITFYFSALLLLTGMLFRLTSPQNEVRKTQEITSWLLTFANDSHSEAASDKLRGIETLGGDGFQSVMEKASVIIAENPDLFNLPIDNDADSDDAILQVLLVQWNLHHQGGGMSAGMQSDRSRSTATQIKDGTAKSWALRTLEYTKSGFPQFNITVSSALEVARVVFKPFLLSISINAP